MDQQQFSLKKRLQSFRFAARGIRSFLISEHNAWIHFAATVVVLVAAAVLPVSRQEWLALVFVIALVWVAEMLNTCVEKIMDYLSTDHHPQIKFIKDVSAGAVLVAALAAAITGAIIFIPKLLSLCSI